MYGSQSKKLDKGIFKIKIAKDTLVWIYMLEELNGQKNQINLNLEVGQIQNLINVMLIGKSLLFH